MQSLAARLAAAALPFLLWNAAAAQNPCGYAFSVTGEKLFEDHCAGCHGLDGKGNGVSAGDQREKPANLTGIAKRNDGKYPAERIAEIIRYGGGLPGHEKGQIMPAGERSSTANAGRHFRAGPLWS